MKALICFGGYILLSVAGISGEKIVNFWHFVDKISGNKPGYKWGYLENNAFLNPSYHSTQNAAFIIYKQATSVSGALSPKSPV